MSIHFITGKPGAGKGVVAMQQIVDELVKGDRAIITNLAVRIDPWVRVVRRKGARILKPEKGLRAYLMEKHGKDFDVGKRVFVIPDDQAGEFYLYRRNCTGLICAEAKRENSRCVEFDTQPAISNGGVLYVLDEAWKFFGARDWSNTGKGVLFYAAQHRKLGDDLLICTQNTKQVDTALRQVTQDFWVVTNHGKMRFGMFRQPDVFSVFTYDQAPTGAMQQPMSRQIFRLDKAGLGSCFDTAAGVGLGSGGAADFNERKTGLPAWAIIILIIVIGYCAWQAPTLFGKLVGWKIRKSVPPREKVVSGEVSEQQSPSPSMLEAASSIGRQLVPVSGLTTNAPFLEVPPEIFVTGVAWVDKKRPRVFLSDGRIARGEFGEIQRIGHRQCVVFGVTNRVFGR